LIPGNDRIKLVDQHFDLKPNHTIAENIRLQLPFYAKGERSRRIKRLLSHFNIQSQADKKPNELSGGQRQRAALATALAETPAVLLLDEPFSHLDYALRQSALSWIMQCVREDRTCVLLVSHEPSELLGYTDRVAFMRKGKFIQIDTPQAIYENPRDLQVGRFFGWAMNASDWPSKLQDFEPAIIRSHHLSLHAEPKGSWVILGVRYVGGRYQVELSHPQVSETIVAFHEVALSIGQHVDTTVESNE
jgi:iron(III) transport system ATP-binding protein